MTNPIKELILKFGIPSLAIIIIIVHFGFACNKNLSKWKGGGYGMYTDIHYYYNKIHISGMSVDSLVKDNDEMKETLGTLMLMPNKSNLKKSGELILSTTQKDSIHIQIWKPVINSKQGIYSRELIDEIHLKNTDF
ncbi:hypothetical protein DFQ11_1089 [Winogradskyella epiphytica]|uniref:Uncharacterized protein n=1 Tax=Winogradskyella epiphytica TaxID=262005 RepID=A0A2V4X4N3_9FLAO|nr:hypothetical protein [Winogradskyella epiphytica]PYE79985.1 hypothetical protein DFQ11_1089 [Winogradskyella epiphytica]